MSERTRTPARVLPCANKAWPHRGPIHARGVCGICYAYSRANEGANRPASLIIADLERKGENPFEFQSRAEEIAMYLATARSVDEVAALINDAREWHSESDPNYVYDSDQLALTTPSEHEGEEDGAEKDPAEEDVAEPLQ